MFTLILAQQNIYLLSRMSIWRLLPHSCTKCQPKLHFTLVYLPQTNHPKVSPWLQQCLNKPLPGLCQPLYSIPFISRSQLGKTSLLSAVSLPSPHFIEDSPLQTCLLIRSSITWCQRIGNWQITCFNHPGWLEFLILSQVRTLDRPTVVDACF